MALTILVRSAEGTSFPRITFDAPRIVIGRGEGCEVRLPDPSVSHRHASIRQRGSEYIVLDEGSTNGTFVGGVRLAPQAPRVIKSGDLVRVGRVWLEIRVEHAIATKNAPLATREMALALVAEALAAEGSKTVPRVLVVQGAGAGTELAVEAFDRAYVVGRAKSADLDLDDVDLSRRHVEIARKGDGVVIRDLGSKNGSRLDDKPLPPNADTPWRKGAILAIGNVQLACDDPVGAALEELERAADERMPASEIVEPPKSDQKPPPDSLTEQAAGNAAPRPSSRPARAPSSGLPISSRPGAWTLTDVLVAFLALAVLGLSVAGLVWLIRSG
jgi:pSer/pThr/pTyr-binding forkhead associated (FHA) protein